MVRPASDAVAGMANRERDKLVKASNTLQLEPEGMSCK